MAEESSEDMRIEILVSERAFDPQTARICYSHRGPLGMSIGPRE